MITIMVDEERNVTPQIYKEILSRIKYNRLICTCGSVGTLKIHAYYYRSIKLGAGKSLFHICRVICESCGHSHAILPSTIIPYSQISLSDQTYIINNYETGRSHNSIMNTNPLIDEGNCRYIIHRYLRYWRHRISKKRITCSSVRGLTQYCFSHYAKQFMQNKRTANILYLHSDF